MDKDLRAKQHDNGDNPQSLQSNALDREIDAVLAQYSAEPRAGIEERVLANLRIERERSPARGWWQWTTVAALVTLLLAASIVFWRSVQQSRHYAARPSQTIQDDTGNRTQVAASQGTNQILRPRPTAEKKKSTAHLLRHVSLHASALAAGPKLDRFPSPQPLSEQEKILASYVARYPEHAALIAQARAEALRQDLAEEMKDTPTIKNSQQDN
ncbi:MAG: hypothetical protein WAL56_01370 [Candidatus Sulfotelmatobacter sp.]